MIAGIILRNFKTYQSINYIPLSSGKKFSALVGENGVGKSSVLEALDSFFNGSDWNFNHSLNKGFSEREPFICPVFIIKNELISPDFEFFEFVVEASEACWGSSVSDFNTSHKLHAEAFVSHRDLLEKNGLSKNTHYLIPFGLKKNSKTSSPDLFFSFFEGLRKFPKKNEHPSLDKLQAFIHSYYEYIYLPSDIDFGEYVKIHGRTTQALLGQKLDSIVRGIVKKEMVGSINKSLNAFLDETSKKLGGYQYKRPSLKQNLVNQSHLTEKIIEAFFESKVLHRIGERDAGTPVGDLSSGEKRQALIDVAKAFLLANAESDKKQVVLAIDEPELSLHVSACFSQFEKLRDISLSGVQSLITTHWYGFMPIISEGVAIYCPKTDSPPLILDLRCFREDIKKIKATTKGSLPAELELKGINDLVQSIIASITGAGYNWLICEGSADKIYLDHYLKDEQIFIVPVGGAVTVKKIYSYLYMALEESRGNVNGKVYCLIDTDKKVELFNSQESIPNIVIKRIKNNEEDFSTDLLRTSDNNFYPPTVIEDTLDAKGFIGTLGEFVEDPKYGELVNEIYPNIERENDEWPSGLATNLKPTDRNALNSLFEEDGFKVKFALKYANVADPAEIPKWICELKTFFARERQKPRGRSRK